MDLTGYSRTLWTFGAASVIKGVTRSRGYWGVSYAWQQHEPKSYENCPFSFCRDSTGEGEGAMDTLECYGFQLWCPARNKNMFWTRKQAVWPWPHCISELQFPVWWWDGNKWYPLSTPHIWTITKKGQLFLVIVRTDCLLCADLLSLWSPIIFHLCLKPSCEVAVIFLIFSFDGWGYKWL